MIIVNFGHFLPVEQDTGYMGVIFYENEDGLDWYELRTGLTNWDPPTGAFVDAVFGAWAVVDPADGVVINVEFNPSKLVPDDRYVLGIDASYKDVKQGMIYRDGELLPPTGESLARIGPPLKTRKTRKR